MKGVPRYIVKKWSVRSMEGAEPMLMLVFSDMTNQELAQALSHFKEQEDFEYCEELVAEAEYRGISLNTKIKSNDRKDNC